MFILRRDIEPRNSSYLAKIASCLVGAFMSTKNVIFKVLWIKTDNFSFETLENISNTHDTLHTYNTKTKIYPPKLIRINVYLMFSYRAPQLMINHFKRCMNFNR